MVPAFKVTVVDNAQFPKNKLKDIFLLSVKKQINEIPIRC
jgi:hypothetical protein